MSPSTLPRPSLTAPLVSIGSVMNTNANANVLIVNDDEAALCSRQWELAVSGCSVLTTRTRKQLFDILNQQAIDVVLMETSLPDADGAALIKAIKAQYPDTQIVVTTEFESLEAAKEAIRLGAHDYLVKPILLDEIRRVVQRAAMQKKWALHRIPGQVSIPSIH